MPTLRTGREPLPPDSNGDSNSSSQRQAALGYYWGQFDPNRFGSEEWAAEQAAAWGRDITQPALYLHGTQDGCHGMTQEQVDRVPQHCGPGSQSELIEGVGHFMMVQRPTDINKKILEFLAA